MSILATDGDDWGDVVGMHEPGLRRLIARRMANQDLVDDALQETYVRAVRMRRRGGAELSDGRRLRTAARWAASDVYRREPPDAVDIDRLAVAADALLPGSDEHLDNVDRHLALQWALARLSPRQRRLLALRGVYELTYQEIAVEEKLSVEAVTAALARAKARLQAHLDAYEHRRAAPAMGLWIAYAWRRLRWRMQDLGPRVTELAAATLAVGVVAALTMPVDSPAHRQPAVISGLAASTAEVMGLSDGLAALAMYGAAATDVLRPAEASLAMPRAPEPERPLLSSRPDVRIDPDESVVRYEVEIAGPTGVSVYTEVELYCTRDRLVAALCPVLATAPDT